VTAPKWQRQCVLCARRGRTTRLETGHVCVPCAGWLATQVADIARLAADAAAWLAPGSANGGSGRPVPGSRPPLRVDALDPELTPIGPPPSPTVLEVVECWERMIRQDRGMAPYGPASQARAREHAKYAREGTVGASYLTGGSNDTRVTLIGCTAFLGRSVPWMTTTPDFPVDDFADEIGACVRVLRRFDVTAEARGTQVRCMTVMDDGTTCDRSLRYRDLDEQVTCRRCGQTRDASTLAMLALEDGRDVWLDPEAAARHFAVDERALVKWARAGRVRVNHGRYLLSSIEQAIEGSRADGYARLARYLAR
jgi:hypothetical protein